MYAELEPTPTSPLSSMVGVGCGFLCPHMHQLVDKGINRLTWWKQWPHLTLALIGEKGDTGERKLDSHGHNDFERNQVGCVHMGTHREGCHRYPARPH